MKPGRCRSRQDTPESGGIRRIVGKRCGVVFSLLLLPGMVLSGGCLWTENPRALRERFVEMDEARLAQFHAQPVPTALTVEDAIHLAVERNLELWKRKREHALTREAATGETLRMLPDLRLGMKTSSVSDPRASYSENLFTGATQQDYNFSSERNTLQSDLTLTFSLLDFGLSLVRARQEAHRALQDRWRLARARQTLAFEVEAAYWRMAQQQAAVESLRPLVEEGRALAAQSRQQVEEKRRGEVSALEFQKRIVNLEIRLANHEAALREGRLQLARLMGAHPHAPFRLVDSPTEGGMEVARVEELEARALRHRPEMMIEDLAGVVARDEAHAAALRLLPNFNLFAKTEHNSDKYLYHNNWKTIGLDLSMHLFQIPQRLHNVTLAEKRKELVDEARLVMAVGVISQVHLACHELDASREKVELVGRLHDISLALADAEKRRLAAGEASAERAFLARLDAVVATNQYMHERGQRQVALARIRHATASDILPASPHPAPYRPLSPCPTVDGTGRTIRTLHPAFPQEVMVTFLDHDPEHDLPTLPASHCMRALCAEPFEDGLGLLALEMPSAANLPVGLRCRLRSEDGEALEGIVRLVQENLLLVQYPLSMHHVFHPDPGIEDSVPVLRSAPMHGTGTIPASIPDTDRTDGSPVSTPVITPVRFPILSSRQE